MRRIQDEALRLFAAQGYDATTVEQIAEAAEVSPSTFFRYYPTKEDTVVMDRFDPVLLDWFTDPDDDRSPLEIARTSIRQAIEQLPDSELAKARERSRLSIGVPSLRSRAIEYNAEMLAVVGRNLARRLGRPSDDIEILTFGGAMMGTLTAVVMAWVRDEGAGRDELLASLDQAMDHLAAGLH